MPVRGVCKVWCVSDLRQDYTLSEEFRKTHYLVGLLIHELKQVLVQPRDMRRCAITVLRNQLAKHAFDDRYAKTVRYGLDWTLAEMWLAQSCKAGVFAELSPEGVP